MLLGRLWLPLSGLETRGNFCPRRHGWHHESSLSCARCIAAKQQEEKPSKMVHPYVLIASVFYPRKTHLCAQGCVLILNVASHSISLSPHFRTTTHWNPFCIQCLVFYTSAEGVQCDRSFTTPGHVKSKTVEDSSREGVLKPILFHRDTAQHMCEERRQHRNMQV